MLGEGGHCLPGFPQGFQYRNHNSGVQHRLGSTWQGRSSVEKDLGPLVDNMLSMSEQCVLQQRNPTGCWVALIRTSPRDEDVIPLSTSQATQCLALVSAMLKRCGLGGKGPGKGHRRDQRSEKPAIWGKAEKRGFVQLEKRGLKADFITMFQYLKDVYKEDGDSCGVTWKRGGAKCTI